MAAMRAINAAMPGSCRRVSRRSFSVCRPRAGQKAAAVNLGIFPDSGTVRLCRAALDPWGRRPAPAPTAFRTSVPLRRGPAAQATPAARRDRQVAYAAPGAGRVRARRCRFSQVRLQLASGSDADALRTIRRLKSHDPRAVRRNQAACREERQGAPVIGPFRGQSDAEIFPRISRRSAWRHSNGPIPLPTGLRHSLPNEFPPALPRFRPIARASSS